MSEEVSEGFFRAMSVQVRAVFLAIVLGTLAANSELPGHVALCPGLRAYMAGVRAATLTIPLATALLFE